MKCQPHCQKGDKNVFYILRELGNHIALDKKVIFRWLCSCAFPR